MVQGKCKLDMKSWTSHPELKTVQMWWRQKLASTHCVFRMQPVQRTKLDLIRQRYAGQGAGLRLMQIYWWQQSLKGTDSQFIDNQAPQPTPASLGSWLVHRQQLEYLSVLVVITLCLTSLSRYHFCSWTFLAASNLWSWQRNTDWLRTLSTATFKWVNLLPSDSKLDAYDVVMSASILAKAKGRLKIKIIYMVATFPRPLSTLH